jgi:SAM-dependent methyltransferase
VGLERNAAALLLKMRSDGVRFGRVVTLGRQHLHLDAETYGRLLRRIGVPGAEPRPTYADSLLTALGATAVDSIDASNYQGATIAHDLNAPPPESLRAQFDLVFDGGTLEHIFDAARALRTSMELVRPGGRFVSASIPNNWCGHGFYQFSPEFFYRALSPANGFTMVEMYIVDVDGRRPFSVNDPAAVGARVELCNSEPLYLLVHARRDRECDIFAAMPQQSDYVRDWSGPEPPEERAPFPAAWKALPLVRHVRRFRQRTLARRRRRERSLANRRFYTPADLRI